MKRILVQDIRDVHGTYWTVRAHTNRIEHGAAITVAGPSGRHILYVGPDRKVRTNERVPVDAMTAVCRALSDGPIARRLWPHLQVVDAS